MLSTLTKYDTLDTRTRRALERTPILHPDDDRETVPCAGCGLPLATEADMARHFTVADRVYLNLGACPVVASATVLGVPMRMHPGNAPMVSLVKHTRLTEPHPAYGYGCEDGCPGCELNGYRLRDRAQDAWIHWAATVIDVAYTARYIPHGAPYGDPGRLYGEDSARVHVTVYEIDRAYGGPEEGGWYFDTGTVIWAYRAASHAAAVVIADTLAAVLWPYGDGPGSYTYSGGSYSVNTSEDAGADYPRERPHYE